MLSVKICVCLLWIFLLSKPFFCASVGESWIAEIKLFNASGTQKISTQGRMDGTSVEIIFPPTVMR